MTTHQAWDLRDDGAPSEASDGGIDCTGSAISTLRTRLPVNYTVRAAELLHQKNLGAAIPSLQTSSAVPWPQ